TFNSTVFAAPGPHTINLGSALPDLSSDMTITGPGANVLSVKRNVAARFRIFTVTYVTVNISGLTLTNGFTADGFEGFNLGVNGHSGTLTIASSTISGNRAGAAGTGGDGGSGGSGGGILNGGTLTITNSTITGNTASTGLGGGIRRSGGTVTLRSSIIAGN